MNTLENKTPSINGKRLFIRFVVAFLVWAVLSVLGFFHGIKLIKVLEPYYVSVVEFVHPEYSARISYDNDPAEPKIELYVTALKQIDYAPGQFLPAGRTIGPTKITVFHTMVPLIIFGVIVLVWPVKSLMEFIILLMLAIPGGLLVTGITSPFQMLGLLDSAFVQAAAQVGYAYHSSAVEWMMFTEGGARWLIPILTGILCAYLAGKIASLLAPGAK